jgi:hypothetical protein
MAGADETRGWATGAGAAGGDDADGAEEALLVKEIGFTGAGLPVAPTPAPGAVESTLMKVVASLIQL